LEFLIVSGMSGAGKSHVARILEDLGYYCVDNMPMVLLPPFAEMCMQSHGARTDGTRFAKVALVTDVRAGQSFDSLFSSLALIRAMNCEYRLLYLEARADVIIRRYKETRRRHPLAQEGESLEQTVSREYGLLEPVRAKATWIVDTTTMLGGTVLRDHIASLLSMQTRGNILVSVISFGFKYGLPQEADLVFDVRFLPNPYHIDELRALSGLDGAIRDFVLKWPQTDAFLHKLGDMMEFLLPQYIAEGKSNLVAAIGCTGGRHRSVTVAQYLHEFLLEREYRSAIRHRDVDK
jgi:UPF0042 nucleotide-binding protein